MIPNSCATHALFSILLNCPELQLGTGFSHPIFLINCFLLQKISNSCATPALVSILLNCPELQLGTGFSHLIFLLYCFLLQMIPNSCATHALVSILLNCPELQLGKAMHPTNEEWKIPVKRDCLTLCCVSGSSWIRIFLALLDLDPDPASLKLITV